MTQAELLLEAIKLDPADDLARLAYADELEAQGQADRADFVRARGEEAVWPAFVGCQRGLVREATAMLADDGDARFCGFGREMDDGGRPYLRFGVVENSPKGPWRIEHDFTLLFERGFVAAVRCTLGAWERHGRSVAASHPLERVELTDKEPREEDNGLWAWAISDDADAPPWRVPDWLASHFPRPWPPYWEWPTHEAAIECLSQALILWARQPVYGPDDRAELLPPGVILKPTKRVEKPRAV